MKHLFTTLSFLFILSINAQENAADYFIPQVQYQKSLYLSEDNLFEGDITELPCDLEAIDLEYFAEYQKDGSLQYKIVHFNAGLFPTEDHAYFLKFVGNSAQMLGYSDYKLKNNLFFDDVVNEDFQITEIQTYYKVPSESYQTQSWSYVDPFNRNTIQGSSYFKTMKIGAYDRKVLVVELKNGDKTKKEFYLKYYGMIALQQENGDYYINDFSQFNLFSKSYLDELGESKSRSLAWDLIANVRNTHIGDSFFNLNGKEMNKLRKSQDSLFGLFEHMFLRNPELSNPYKYILCVGLYSTATRIFDEAELQKKTASNYETVRNELNKYHFIRPYAEAISKYNLSTYVTRVDEFYYVEFWKIDYCFLKLLPLNSKFEKRYITQLTAPVIYYILNSDANIDNVNKCILYAYVADYYRLLNDEGNEYLYLVKSVENYKYLPVEDKDLNIEYMRAVMGDLATIKPNDEYVLNRAIAVSIDLKDYSNAVKIAVNGLNRKVGQSVSFAVLYAEAAYQDELNKLSLRSAMDILTPKLNELNVDQLNNYIKYCRALSPEYNCSKAESLLKKARKKQTSHERSNNRGSGKSYSSNSRSVNLAILCNPFAGANISGNGGFFKYLPMSAELRTGRLVHEFRYNPFFGAEFKNRFIGGKLNTESNLNSKWQNLKGADYSYGLFFMKNDKGYNGKECTSGGVGLQFLYGSFHSDAERTNVTINNVNGTILVTPQIQRYEALFNFKYVYFDWSSHVSGTMFYGFGLGMREISYNNSTFSESVLKDKDQTKFQDQRFVQNRLYNLLRTTFNPKNNKLIRNLYLIP